MNCTQFGRCSGVPAVFARHNCANDDLESARSADGPMTMAGRSSPARARMTTSIICCTSERGPEWEKTLGPRFFSEPVLGVGSDLSLPPIGDIYQKYRQVQRNNRSTRKRIHTFSTSRSALLSSQAWIRNRLLLAIAPFLFQPSALDVVKIMTGMERNDSFSEFQREPRNRSSWGDCRLSRTRSGRGASSWP